MEHEKRPAGVSLVVDAGGAAELLNMAGGASSFYAARPRLEDNGFPKKLPGINGWSKACIKRWVETNGETYLPGAPAQAMSGNPGLVISTLEGRYAR